MGTANDLKEWLIRACRPDGAVRTRYNVVGDYWEDSIRPDCNTETMYSFALAGMLDRVGAIWGKVESQQNTEGWWTFYDGTTTDWWTNDNAEVVIHLLRTAELDEGNGPLYVASALRTCDWFVDTQRADGTWRFKAGRNTSSPMFNAHVVSALAMGHEAADDETRKSAYLSAIEVALETVIDSIRGNGRVGTCWEYGADEQWRPPSSDQAIVIRALAMAEENCSTSVRVGSWRAARQRLLEWLTLCVDDSTGAVVNGLGENASGADTRWVADNVYTTAFAVEAFALSGELTIAKRILQWVATNVWYNSSNPDEDGCVRGAWNLKDKNWDTQSLVHTEEGVDISDSAYTGWSAAPLMARYIELGMGNYGVGQSTGRRRIPVIL